MGNEEHDRSSPHKLETRSPAINRGTKEFPTINRGTTSHTRERPIGTPTDALIGQQYALLILAHSGRNWNILRQKQYISIWQFTIKGRVPHHVWAAKTRSSPTRRVMRRSSMCSNRGKTYFRVVSRTSRASAAVILPCTRRYVSSFANASS